MSTKTRALTAKAYDLGRYPAFSVNVDVVVLTVAGGAPQALAVRRGVQPFAGSWAVPWGFKRPEETLDEDLPEIDVPTLILHGAQDLLVSAVNAKQLARQIPNSKVTVLAHCGHQLFTDRPGLGARMVLEFLSTIDRVDALTRRGFGRKPHSSDSRTWRLIALTPKRQP